MIANEVLPDYLPARMLNEFVYCPRLFFYEWVEGIFVENRHTVEGSLRHAKIDKKQDKLASAEEAAESDEKIHSRSVTLSSDTHRLIAKMDLIEGTGNVVSPVDYKHGSPYKNEDGTLSPRKSPSGARFRRSSNHNRCVPASLARPVPLFVEAVAPPVLLGVHFGRLGVLPPPSRPFLFRWLLFGVRVVVCRKGTCWPATTNERSQSNGGITRLSDSICDCGVNHRVARSPKESKRLGMGLDWRPILGSRSSRPDVYAVLVPQVSTVTFK